MLTSCGYIISYTVVLHSIFWEWNIFYYGQHAHKLHNIYNKKFKISMPLSTCREGYGQFSVQRWKLALNHNKDAAHVI